MVTHLAETGSIHHDLVNLAHFLQEKVYSGPLKDVKVMPMVLYLDWDDKIRLLDSLNIIWCSMVQLSRGNVGYEIWTRTLKLLCTSVSSRSRTRHFRPACCGAIGGSRGRGTPSW